jgi:hypothetical protein
MNACGVGLARVRPDPCHVICVPRKIMI